jgi:glycosyltransferase involved in cell wall biosynthesis
MVQEQFQARRNHLALLLPPEEARPWPFDPCWQLYGRCACAQKNAASRELPGVSSVRRLPHGNTYSMQLVVISAPQGAFMRAIHGLIPNIPSAQNNLLICFSHLRWNFVYQRPQHLLSRAAKSDIVYFLEEPVFEDISSPRLDLRTTDEGVMVGVPILPHGMSHEQVVEAQQELLDDLLLGLPDRPIILWYYTPMALEFSRHLRPDVCVYDNMDELSAFRGAPPPLIAMERELFERADVIFTGGESLYEAKQGRHHNVRCFPSSIDVSHFGKARLSSLAPAADQAGLPAPRLGFFGVIDERMDIDLVGEMADLRPDWQFIMIGPVVKIDPNSLPQRANLQWLGPREYRDLPRYLKGWDVGIMPFAMNEATRFISPTKTPEFLAAGIPVVSTPIKDVVRPYGKLGLVEIASDAEDMVAKCEMLLSRPKQPWLASVDEHLSKNSWDRTWERMREAMGRVTPRAEKLRAPARQESANV